MAPRIDVRVLGRPHVVVDDAISPIVGRQLNLTLRLAFAGQAALTLGRLVEDVWTGGAGTEGAARVALTRLRGALGHDAVVREQNGYALAPDIGIDADRFERLLHRARDRSLAIRIRVRLLDQALAEWRGPAFDDVERPAWVDAEAIRLDELHEQAVDLRFELRSVIEEPASLIAELRTAVDLFPARERRAEMLALALYRSGRQSDALDVVTRTRDSLRDRHGLEVSPALSELEMRILRQDPDLLPVTSPRAGDGAAVAEAQLGAAVALVRIGVYEEALVILAGTMAGARASGDQRTLALAQLVQAQALSMSGGGDPHWLIGQAQAIARASGDGELLARAALVHLGSGVPEDKSAALVELTEPLELLAADAPERVDLLCAAAVIVTFSDASPAAERLLDAARRAHTAMPTLRSEAICLATGSIVAAVQGADVESVHEMAARSFAVARLTDDAAVTVAAIQALLRSEYMLGNLRAVAELLPELEQASRAALLPFGAVRVSLCRTTNAIARGELEDVQQLIDATMREGNRYGTFSTETAATMQQLLLLFECDELDLLADLVRPRAKERGPGVWHAVLALCEPGRREESLIDVARRVPVDDAFWPFVALAAEVGARRGDSAIGRWCASRLDELGDRTITVGLGTAVMGFATHFAALAHVATGSLDAARVRFDRAVKLAADNGAGLWEAHSTVELADVYARSDDPHLFTEARLMLAALRVSPVVCASNRLARRMTEVDRAAGAR